tara:strand:- start:1431 stop:1943 length:513 start_codon:yes stop_codon:yes gene_type:complete
MQNVIVNTTENDKVIKVYSIDENGYKLNYTGYKEELFDPKTMIPSSENPISNNIIKPKWDREKKEWTEGASEEELSTHLESIKNQSTESIKSQTSSICLSIASELEQSNWINFPEDYDPSEIEEKKNQIREIRTRGREIRANIDAAQSLEELSQVDMNLIPLPEQEELPE